MDLTPVEKRDCRVCQLKRRRSVGWPTVRSASRRARRAPALRAASALTRPARPAFGQPCRRHFVPAALGGRGAQAAVLPACFQGCASRSMVLRVTSNFRIRATVAVLAVLPAAIVIAERRFAAGGGAGGHVESGGDRGAAAGDGARALAPAAVVVERGEADQGGDGASVEPTELGQQRQAFAIVGLGTHPFRGPLLSGNDPRLITRDSPPGPR